MAGGNFTKGVSKTRPGTYINFESTREDNVGKATRGIVTLPLINHPWGPAQTWISIENTSPDAHFAELGYRINDAQMLLVREALKNARSVLVYIPVQGSAATKNLTTSNGYQYTVPAAGLVKESDGADVEYYFTAGGATSKFTLAADLVENDKLQWNGTTLTVIYASGASSITLSTTLGTGDTELTLTSVTLGVNITATAKYGGTRGNSLSFDIAANPVSGYDVNVYLGTETVISYAGLSTVGDLQSAATEWVTFSGTEADSLAPISAAMLTGGTDGSATAENITGYLDASEGKQWTVMCFPLADTSLLDAAKTKIKYLRDEAGKYRQIVVADYAGDYEGIINVVNSVKLEDGTSLTHIQATAFVAGITAGANYVTSNTYVPYVGAVDIVDPLSHNQAVAAIQAGKFFFSFTDNETVVIEYDINSLITIPDNKDKTWKKNRVVRVFDSFAERIVEEFPPNKFPNNAIGWDVMDGIGKTLLQEFEEAGGIKNVDYGNDFAVERDSSDTDETYFNVAIQSVDSAEKLYFAIKTR